VLASILRGVVAGLLWAGLGDRIHGTFLIIFGLIVLADNIAILLGTGSRRVGHTRPHAKIPAAIRITPRAAIG
jgi:hypothetical protein